MPALEERDGKCDKCQGTRRKDDEKEIGAACVLSGRRAGSMATIFGSCEPPVMLDCLASSQSIASLLTAWTCEAIKVLVEVVKST